jgi:hypothetical protein
MDDNSKSKVPLAQQFPMQPSIDNARPEDETTGKGDKPPELPPPGTNLEPAQEGRGYRKACRPDQVPWWKYLIEVAGVLAVVAYTMVANRQLGVLGGQLTQMQQSSGQTDQMIGLVRQQLEQITKQATETHTLAEAAKQQAGTSVTVAIAAKSAADTANRQLDLSERPWVHSEFTPTSLIFNESGGFLNLNVTITNIGHSVARSISVWTELDVDTGTTLSEGERWCQIPRNKTNKDYRGGFILFPGEHRTLDQPAAVVTKEIQKALATGAFKDNHMVTIDLITCIDYGSPLDSGHHQTRRYFTLGRLDPISHAVLGVFDPHATYAPSQIVMTPEPWDYAD